MELSPRPLACNVAIRIDINFKLNIMFKNNIGSSISISYHNLLKITHTEIFFYVQTNNILIIHVNKYLGKVRSLNFLCFWRNV